MNTPSSLPTLAHFVEHLRVPFPVTEIKFLPKSAVQRNNAWVCLALPYADKRAYEDRLNALVPGRWSTPAMSPLVAGNKLVIPVTLVICDIAHTDVGEAFLTSLSRKGEPREEENAATEAYSQAFRRACAQFGLGRYLYDLPKAWVPYDPQKRAIALSEEELRRLAEQLYRKAGLLPTTSSAMVHGAAGTSSLQEQSASVQQRTGLSLEPVQGTVPQTDEGPSPKPVSPAAPPNGEIDGDLREAGDRINPYQQSWVERQLGGDAMRIARVCQFYHVSSLEDLSGLQTIDLVNRLFAEQAKARKNQATERSQHADQQNGRKAVAR